MTATVISFAEWKASHPPALVCYQHGLQCLIAWQRLYLMLMFPGGMKK